MNPYEPSQTTQFPTAQGVDEHDLNQSPWPIWRQIFLSWERWRLIYNGLLLLVTLGGTMMVASRMFPFPSYWLFGLTNAFIVNVAYLLGPITECYLTWITGRRLRWGIVLFVLGTLMTLLAAWAWIKIMQIELNVN